AARELDCVVRTIWRDLRVLQGAAFPIYDDKAPDGQQGLWRVSEEFKRELPLKLSLAELAALLMSRQLLSPAGASLLGPAVTSAFDKITGVLSRDALQVIDRMRDTVKREIDPYHLTYFNGGLYLVGYCHLRRAIRVFAMERIRGLDVLSRRFALPTSFDPEKYLAGALGIISGDLV